MNEMITIRLTHASDYKGVYLKLPLPSDVLFLVVIKME